MLPFTPSLTRLRNEFERDFGPITVSFHLPWFFVAKVEGFHRHTENTHTKNTPFRTFGATKRIAIRKLIRLAEKITPIKDTECYN